MTFFSTTPRMTISYRQRFNDAFTNEDLEQGVGVPIV